MSLLTQGNINTGSEDINHPSSGIQIHDSSGRRAEDSTCLTRHATAIGTVSTSWYTYKEIQVSKVSGLASWNPISEVHKVHRTYFFKITAVFTVMEKVLSD